MAHMQYLVFNNENIPKPASYSVNLTDVEADSGGVTEAGTTQRDVVREGVVQIGVTFRVSKKWLNKFSAYKKLASITVGEKKTTTIRWTCSNIQKVMAKPE